MSREIGDIACGGNRPEDAVLAGDTVLDVGFGWVSLCQIDCSNNHTYTWGYFAGIEGEAPTLIDFEKVFGNYLRRHKATRFRLCFYGPLHDETFEYKHGDGKWHLIQQGRGFA